MTTAPAPIRAPSPIVTPARITAPLPIDAPRQTRVGMQLPVGVGLEFAVLVGRAGVQVVGEHDPVADEDLVLHVTPEQMKVWLEILHRAPILAPAWISTNAPIAGLVTHQTPVKVREAVNHHVSVRVARSATPG